MTFSTLEVLTEHAEVTDLVPGGDVWFATCERSLRTRLAKAREWYASLPPWERDAYLEASAGRYAAWIADPDNHRRKLAYMSSYNQLPARKAAKLEYDRRRRRAYRAANPLPVRDCKYKQGCKRVESKETRRARYLRAKAARAT